MGLFEKIFGTHSEKELKKINPIVDAIEALDEKMQALSDEELRGKTQEFKDRLAAGEMIFCRRHLQRFVRQVNVF